jgi:hypothetical protein
MQIIPVQAIAAQNFSVTLNGQDCLINIYQKSTGMYFDLTLNGTLIVSTFICLDRVFLVRYPYLGFIGNLSFVDTQGTNDPQYQGLGTRYIFVYFLPSDINP